MRTNISREKHVRAETMLIRFILHGFPHYIRLMADEGMWGKRERECKGERDGAGERGDEAREM